MPVFAVGAWDSGGIMHAGSATQTLYGNEVKVLWVVSPETVRPVTLQGASVSTGLPLFFEIGNSPPTMSATLDPSKAPTNDGGWTYWPSYLDVPTADCYYLQAKWSGGQWRVEFPAGQ